MNKKKIFWAIAFLFIAALSIWAVAAQSNNFSTLLLFDFIEKADKKWLLAAFICMLGFIWFEGFALVRIFRHFGYKTSSMDGFVYGAADVYFSAITPSASGGQPASAYFMIKDGIAGYAATVALLINLVMYTIALLVTGVFFIILKFDIFYNFSLVSRVFIFIGSMILGVLAICFLLLLKNGEVLYKFCDAFLKLFEKLHLLKRGQNVRKKLQDTMHEYQQCSNSITGKRKMLIEIFFWNIMQRLSQLFVSFMIFMAVGKGVDKALDVTAVQCFVALGSNCVPIPGAMGVADYIMLDGFKGIVGDAATTLELLCRGFTFYGSVLASAFIILIGYLWRKVRK